MYGISVVLVIVIRGITYLWFTLQSGIVRFTSLADIERILIAMFLSSLVIFGLSTGYRVITGHAIIPLSVIIIDFLLVVILTSIFRLLVKTLYFTLMHPNDNTKQNALIIGNYEFCETVKDALIKDRFSTYKAIAFASYEESLTGKKIGRIKFSHISKLNTILSGNKFHAVLFSESSTSFKFKGIITEACLKYHVKPVLVPDIHKLLSGELVISQFREVRVEDLLDRKPVEFDKKSIYNEIEGRVILITGAAGSIGSELARQLATFKPKRLILLDQAETPLFDIVNRLKFDLKFSSYEEILCCVTNTGRINQVFNEFRPEIVYHAAAYKHVPMMEQYPAEAVRVNILGTKIIADCAVKYGAKKFVMISTDKAINPTNVMGASKRIAEIYCQEQNGMGDTAFIVTRFGNVIGSNGSVIPLFREQIKSLEKVTVTHPDITRFFMSIPEACQLVIQAGVMGHGNEIFIFDMGEAVRIYDIACKMIKLSGYKVEEEIKIEFTGLRPGEKLYEELLTDKEDIKETYHPRIMIAGHKCHKNDEYSNKINELLTHYRDWDNMQIVRQMKIIVPEYKSNNSVYEAIDRVMNESNRQLQNKLV